MAASGTKTNLSDDHLAFYVAIGRAITAFSNVERQLASVFTTATRDKARAATDALFAVPTFDFKLRATTAAVDAALAAEPGLLTDWTKLRNRAIKASEKRNMIAHNTIWIEHATRYDKNNLSRKNPDDFPNGKLWIASIHTPHSDSEAQLQKFHSKRLDTARISDAAETFNTLTLDINEYANRIRPRLTR